jgi:hypothetical protein
LFGRPLFAAVVIEDEPTDCGRRIEVMALAAFAVDGFCPAAKDGIGAQLMARK